MSPGYETVLERSYNAQVQNIAGKYLFFLVCTFKRYFFMNDLMYKVSQYRTTTGQWWQMSSQSGRRNWRNTIVVIVTQHPRGLRLQNSQIHSCLVSLYLSLCGPPNALIPNPKETHQWSNKWLRASPRSVLWWTTPSMELFFCNCEDHYRLKLYFLMKLLAKKNCWFIFFIF